MTEPHEIISAITNLERELQDLGWRPVEMTDEESGIPFTRWFPPVKQGTKRSNHDFEATENAGEEVP